MIKKKDNESIKQYKIRLCENKVEYGLTYPVIAELVSDELGHVINEKTIRMWYKDYTEGYSDAKNDMITSDDLIQEYEDKRIQFEKAKVKFYDQRKLYNQYIRTDARNEELYNCVKESLSNIEPYPSYNVNISKNTLLGDNDLFIGFNDVHYGQVIDLYWNKYNPDILKERLDKYLDNIIKIKNTHNSENAYVCCNGDVISGKIHKQIEVSNCEVVTDQIKHASEIISWFLAELSHYFKNVYFSLVSGNHSRIDPKKEASKGDRLDKLVPWYLEARLQNINNIKFIPNEIDDTMSLCNIRGKNYLGVHGDYDSFSSSLKLISMINEPIYCVHMGHKHHNASDWTQKYKNIMSGSFSGIDNHCVEHRIDGRAQQMVCVCDDSGILCEYNIDLQDVI